MNLQSSQEKNQSSHSVLHGLETTDKAGRQADQRSVTTVQPAEDKSSDKRLKDGCRDELADAAQLMQSCKAARHRLTHM